MYTGDRWPADGSVWVVDKTEHSVDASIKIGVEYPTVDALGGHLITLGAHCYFADAANPNRPQLSRIITDSLLYLGDNDAPARGTEEPDFEVAGDPYWQPGESCWRHRPGAMWHRQMPDRRPTCSRFSTMSKQTRSGIEMVGFPTADVAAPFTIASPTAVVYGSQMGRIEAFWAHPLRILRSLRFAVVRPDRGVTWLDTGGGDRTFTARPEGSELVYTDGEIQVSLRFAVDRRHGAFVALIAVRSPAALDLVATWETDLSSDWPRRQPVLGPLEIAWDEGAQAVVWRDRPESYRAMAGFGGAPSLPFLGFDPERHIDEGGLVADPMLSSGRVATQVRIEPEPGRPTPVSFVAVGGYDANPNAAAVYAALSAHPGGPWTANAAYYQEFPRRPHPESDHPRHRVQRPLQMGQSRHRGVARFQRVDGQRYLRRLRPHRRRRNGAAPCRTRLAATTHCGPRWRPTPTAIRVSRQARCGFWRDSRPSTDASPAPHRFPGNYATTTPPPRRCS